MHSQRTLVALLVASVLLLVQAASGVSISDVVNQVDQQLYRHYLDDMLYTHLGSNKGLAGTEHDLVRDTILSYFATLNLQASLDPQPAAWYGPACVNIVAIKPGTLRPQDIYIIAAHYDSVNNPGADDNGSAVAALMEAARILNAYSFEATIVFCIFDVEEMQPGYYERVGSRGYAAAHQNDNILGVVALDMIAHNSGTNRAYVGSDRSPTIQNRLANAISLYGQGLTAVMTGNLINTDNWSFLPYGFDNCYLTEEWTNPNYHLPSDSIDTPGNIDYAYATNMTRSVVGYLVTEARLIGLDPDTVPPLAVSNLSAIPSASIESVDMAWTAPADYDSASTGPYILASYDLRYGTTPITDDDAFAAATPVTRLPGPRVPGSAESFTVRHLIGGATYYFAIKSKDRDGNVSLLSNVVTATPIGADATAPIAVTDLHAQASAGIGAIDLTWTAPGDYGWASSGPFTAITYDLRYSTSEIAADNWASATPVTGLGVPKEPGQAESFTVTGLTGGTQYFFAIEATDANGNVSALSNVATSTPTGPDTTVPIWVGNLIGRPSSSIGGVDLVWTAPADYGYNHTGPYAPASYDLRYSSSPIRYDDNDATWNAATSVAALPRPATPGSPESFTVIGLNGGTRYYFAIRTTDANGNVSEISNCAPAKPSLIGEWVLQNGLAGYSGVHDSYCLSYSSTNYAASESMIVAGYADQGGANLRRGLLRFDLATLPAGVTIVSARLCLYSHDPLQTTGNSGFYGVYPVTTNWADTQVNWRVARSGVSWTKWGGDFPAAPDATAAKQAGPDVWYNWDVTSRVRNWAAGSGSNYGWIIKCTDETLHNRDAFYQADTSNMALRPKLVLSDVPASFRGDVNGDGKINVADLLILGDNLGRSVSQRGYDPRCDLNADGAIDAADLTDLAGEWPD